MSLILRKYEFNCLPGPDGDTQVKHDDQPIFVLRTGDREFIQAYIQLLRSKRPKALTRLSARFEDSKKNRPFFDFLIVRQHIRCNFSAIDDIWDIDESGNFRTEYVFCPNCSECPDYGWICNNSETVLLKSEIRVLRLIKDGHNNKEISELLFISEHTVHNHRNSILNKTESKNTADMVRYWFINEMDKL